MKKIYLFLSFIAFSVTSNAQTLLSENFDALGSPIVLPSGWEMLNLSSPIGTASWFRGNTASFTAYEGPTDGYIGVNYQSGSGVATLNNWLMSPAITVQNGDEVSFYSRVPANSSWADRLELRMSTAGSTSTAPSGLTDMGSYTTLALTINPTLVASQYPQVWTKYSYTVSGLTGQVSCRFALRYHVTNGGPSGANSNYIGVDSFKVKRPINNDLSLTSVTTQPIIAAGNYTFNGVVENAGSNVVTSYDVTWQANGGAVNTYSVTGANIASGATHNFTHSIPLNAVGGQTYSLVFNISNVNGSTDPDTSNNSLSKSILVVNEIYPKTVVYEEGTGPWCGWCVRGHVGLKDMHHFHNDDTWIGIAVHNGSTNPMKLVEYDTAVSARISGYPSGLLNRGANEVDPGYSELNAAYTAELARVPVGKIEITNQSWNATTRQLTAQVSAKFALDIAGADYNVAVVVIENNVTGTTTAYNQLNYYNSNGIDIIDWEGINWRNLGNPIAAASMVYQHVGRALLGGFNGQTGVVPAAVTYNTPYTYTFTHTLAAGQDETDVELVALLIDNSKTTKDIVNAKKVELNTTLGVNDFKGLTFSFYPNPSNGSITFNTEKELQIEIIDLLGKTMVKKAGIMDNSTIDLSNLSDGVYVVNVTDGVSTTSQKLVLKK